jgi:uncharacterized protein (DUF2267 family)
MSSTGLRVFDSTLQATNIWLDQIMEELDWTNRHKAWHALRATLHALRDRLPLHEAVQLAAQLPMLIRGMYYEGWRPTSGPVRDRRPDEFVAHVTDAFVLDAEADAWKITAAVLKVLSMNIDYGEVSSVQHCLPRSFRELWRGKLYAT